MSFKWPLYMCGVKGWEKIGELNFGKKENIMSTAIPLEPCRGTYEPQPKSSPLTDPALSTRPITVSPSSKMFFEGENYKKGETSKAASQFKSVLDKCEAVLLEREQQFKGSADGMFAGIAAVASDLCGNHHEPVDAAAVLLALKIERMKANPEHEDSLVDCIDYLMFFHKELCKARAS